MAGLAHCPATRGMEGVGAAGGLGALAVLCRYAGANEDGVRLALDQGRTVVFRGDHYEFRVRFDAPGRDAS